ncbi:MAG: FG-GAP-like repeat-containing protein [Thermodesulfobacteriota bacterium]
MKHWCKWLVCLLCLAATGAPSWAKDSKRVAILPFSVHSAENIDYVRQGIADMLSSRISVNENIEVASRDAVMAVLKESGVKEPSQADVYALGKKLNADFVVWGSITKFGNSLSIDGRLADVGAAKSALTVVSQSQNMDEVIPKVTDFAYKIEVHILGGAPAVQRAAPAAKDIIVSRQPTAQSARESEIISGMKSTRKGTLTASINPDFINAVQPLESKSFWKSQQFSYDIKGIDIGDVNGDGLNETVMIDGHNLYIYQKKGKQFTLLEKIDGKRHHKYIAVDVADINGNGIKEIIVSSYAGTMVNSFIIEYRNGRYEMIAQDLPWLMRVIHNSGGMPVLLGQYRGMAGVFTTPIHEIVWQNGQYREGRKMRIPEGLSVYGVTLEKLTPGGPEMVIALNEDDHLCIYEQTDKPLSQIDVFGGSPELRWKSDEPFGGSNTFVEPVLQSSNPLEGEESKSRYINPRIITYDTNKDGKREIILVRNISSSGRLFERVKLFTSAEVYNLEWDNMGMVENWRTKKISGYVADYQFKDMDGDGENEIVLALVISGSALTSGRSVIVSYSIRGQ